MPPAFVVTDEAPALSFWVIDENRNVLFSAHLLEMRDLRCTTLYCAAWLLFGLC
jgi:hypothetical protein